MRTPTLKFACRISLAAGALLFAAGDLRGGDDPQSSTGAESKTPQFVYVSGEVKIPQRYIYTNGMTLVAAIEMAGGVTDFGAQKQVKLTRGSRRPVVLDLRDIQDGKRKDIKLEAEDKVFVPRRS